MGQSTDVPRRRRRHQPAGLLRTLRLPSLLVVLDMAHATLAFCPGAGLSTAVGTRYNRHVDDGQLVSLMSAFTGSVGEVGKVGGAQYARGGLTQTSMMASSVAPPRTKAEKKNEFFRAKKDRMVEFGSSQRVEASISGASLSSMQEYIADPARIVFACWDHDAIERMEDGVFRLRFVGQNFLSVSIDMSVDIKLWAGADGKVQCKSVGYSVEDMAKLLGQEFIDTFFLELEGELRVDETETKVRALTLKNTLLSGDVEVTVGGKMPVLMAATPEPLVKAASLGINQRVLEYVSSTFVATIARDYRQWAREQMQTQKAP